MVGWGGNVIIQVDHVKSKMCMPKGATKRMARCNVVRSLVMLIATLFGVNSVSMAEGVSFEESVASSRNTSR